MRILSRQHRLIKLLRAVVAGRKQREREGLYAVEGCRVVREALRAGRTPVYVLLRDPPRDPEAQQLVVDEIGPVASQIVWVAGPVLDSAIDVTASVDIVSLFELVPLADSLLTAQQKQPLAALVLEQIRDPGNLGTILRAAHAAGLSGVVLVGDCTDFYSPKVVRSTAGSLFHVPVAAARKASTVREMLSHARHLGTSTGQGDAWDQVDLRGPVALWFGNEDHGLSPEARDLCDGMVHIPIVPMADSLNVATAASVLAFELVRQRRNKPDE